MSPESLEEGSALVRQLHEPLLNNLRVSDTTIYDYFLRLQAQISAGTADPSVSYQSTTLGNQFKPAILQCFGDIAQAIGGDFEMYLSVVAQVLQQAAGISVQGENANNFEMLDYVVSLREGIMDAWGGIIMAMRAGNKANLLQPFVESIFQLLHTVFQDQNRTEALLRSSMGVVG